MRRYRIGKDVANRIRVRTNGEFTPLAGRDITLQMTDSKGIKTWENFTIVDDYKMLFVFYGKDQKYTGTYQLTVWENYGKVGQTVVDCIGAFRLVANTTLEGGEDPEGLDTEVNDLELSISTAEGGAEGVGIASIEQTVTSTEDGGINEVTQTLTDGTTAVFQIRNGSKGSQGVQGERGEKGDAGEDWIPTQQELASIASSAAALVDVPTKTSDLQNDSGFITGYTETDPTVPSWAKQSTKPTYTASEVGALPSSTTIPTKTSDLTNDSGFVTSSDIPEGAAASTTTPLMDGTASVGSETAFARGDHRHPSDTNKQDTISDLATIRSGAGLGATAYQKPSGGIPKTDLENAVQTSLGKADTALQSFTESDPTVPSWAKQSTKPTYTASEVGALPASTTIPSALADLSDDSTHRTVTDTEKSTWNAKGTYSKPSGGIPASDIASGVIPTVPTTVSSFSNDANYVASTTITTIVSLTQAQYDALATKDANTLYIIPEE